MKEFTPIVVVIFLVGILFTKVTETKQELTEQQKIINILCEAYPQCKKGMGK